MTLTYTDIIHGRSIDGRLRRCAMRLPEKMIFTLPPSDASFMKVKAELIDENTEKRSFWKQSS